ncbi:MAG: hypothetical protein KA715_04805, partial [Xanthomonadaceae bacterium]|nr:hypothetical protein [Xanthomonadaceae bacterium]
IDDFFNHEKFGSQFAKSTPTDKTAVYVLITDQIRANGNIEFNFHFSADPEYFDMEDIKIGIELDQKLDNFGRLKEIVSAIFKGAIPFLEVKTDISGEKIVVTFKAPEKTPAPDSGSYSPFYGELNTSASTCESAVNSIT